jgi:hypothetical protein
MSKDEIKALEPLFIPVVLLLLGLYIVHTVTSSVKSIITNKKTPEEIERSRKAIQGIITSGKQTYSTSEFIQMSNAIYQAFKGMGTDNDTVTEIFRKLKNQDDYNMIIIAFGIKDGMNFFDWIRDKIPQSSPIRLSINDLNEILAARGIKQYHI